jgi:mannose-6-phosphate isomerase-like protein (cupin superfamily)
LLLVCESVTATQSRPAPGATDVLKSHIDAVLRHTGAEGAGTDRQAAVVDAGKYNVGVGVLHRAALKSGSPVVGISHAHVTEVYQIISGGGMLVTGGTLTKSTPIPADSEIVTVAVGASASGPLEGGVRRQVTVGDIVIIPPGVLHGFVEIPDHVTYTSIRIDGDHVLPAGYVHPALRK